MATLMGACTGRIIYTREELDTWVREHMAALIQSGRLFNKDAYKECCKILKRFKAVGAIIPEDEEADMERLMNRVLVRGAEWRCCHCIWKESSQKLLFKAMKR
jgi:hypothetical protein